MPSQTGSSQLSHRTTTSSDSTFEMPRIPSNPPRHRIYILGKQFCLGPGDDAVGVMVQGKETMPLPHTNWESTLPPLTSTKVFGFHVPPFVPAIWDSLTKTQPGGFLMRQVHRALDIFNNFRDLWNDFCFWSNHRRHCELEPTPVEFDMDEQMRWRGSRAAQYQLGYQDPSTEPKWRMKQIIEVKDYSNQNEVFHAYCQEMTWYARRCYPILSPATRSRLTNS